MAYRPYQTHERPQSLQSPSPAFMAYRWAARGMGVLMAAGVAVSVTACASLLLFFSSSFAGVACANGWPACDRTGGGCEGEGGMQ